MADAGRLRAALKRRVVAIDNSFGHDDIAYVTMTLDCGHKRRVMRIHYERFAQRHPDAIVECRRQHPDEGLTVGERLRRSGALRREMHRG